MQRSGLKSVLRRGLVVLIALAVLTGIEYAVLIVLGR